MLWQLWLELGQISDQNVLEIKVQEYGSQVSELWEALMGFEMQLVDQLEVSQQIQLQWVAFISKGTKFKRDTSVCAALVT